MKLLLEKDVTERKEGKQLENGTGERKDGKEYGTAGAGSASEDALEAAKRELMEETGLRLVSIDDHIGSSYSAVGFSNEMNVCVVGKCEGDIRLSDSSFEEIQAAWYTRKEVRELLKTERFAARTQAYCYLWSRED